MIAFAGNSLLCRVALRETGIDAASFTTVRLLSGAVMLWALVRLSQRRVEGSGSWVSALALFGYAAAFSFAYLGLSAGMGALLLFGAVQATMISHGLWQGEQMRPLQWLGFLLAFGGLVGLLLPGSSAPPLVNAVLMLAAGVAWGVYSLRGRGKGDPTRVTAGNFARAVPFTLALSVLMMGDMAWDPAGLGYAVASGALASGMGYAVWYMALPLLRATSAATIQLSVPVIAALGGVLLLGESLTARLVLTAMAILGGIALVILEKQKAAAAS
ncbi:DMT family transporter [Marinobacter caseinilyticus]|uniref:DMT family transporter n=1 Tax=Marinobacter caseinilyticus TaxID=2692195 RepID=UPI00140AEA6B|nr:DMT family transporter [Marinobacter caseinilyticus]